MKSIGIAEVLARLSVTVDPETTAVKEYGIKFYTADGALRKLTVRKYTRGPLQSTTGEDKRGKAAHNLQRNGLIKLQDLTNGRTIDVRVTSIYGFCDFQYNQWFKVFH